MTEIYQELESIRNFNEFSDASHYASLPGDWSVIISHVSGAEAAIAAGRYRDVNTIGAMCITAVKNVMKEKGVTEFPYVFGGDGATIVLPEEHRLDAVDALLALSRLVTKKFKLTLAVGSMFVRQLEAQGTTVEVARYEINEGMCIALFRGGGVALADRLIKTGQATAIEEQDMDTSSSSDHSVNLEGLTCRWKKIPSKKGCILTVLVFDNPKIAGNIYNHVAAEIDAIIGGRNVNHNPVHVDIAKYKSVYQIVKEERRFHESTCNGDFLYQVITIIVCVLVFKYGVLKEYFFDSVSYKNDIQKHADHRKFDDMLRMVIDCTQDQANAIEFMLQDLHQHGQHLYYGVFYSTHSLMTCLVDSTSAGNHIHFVDGDSGGYALAAKAMRTQMAEEASKQEFVLHGPIQSIAEDDELSVDLLESPRIPNMNNARGTSFAQLTVNAEQAIPVLLDDERENEEVDFENHDHYHEEMNYEEDDNEEVILVNLESGRQFDPEDIEMGEHTRPTDEKKKSKKKKKKKSKKSVKEDADKPSSVDFNASGLTIHTGMESDLETSRRCETLQVIAGAPPLAVDTPGLALVAVEV